MLALIAAAVAAGVALVLLVGGGDDPAEPGAEPSAQAGEIEVGKVVDSVVVGELNVLVGAHRDSTLHTIDPETGQLDTSPKTVAHPTSVAVGFGSIWVTSGSEDQLIRYGPDNRDVARPIDVGDEPVDVAVDQWVWVVNRADGTVTQIDPLNNSIKATLEVAPRPQSVVTDGNVAWVASPSAGQLTRLDSSGEETTALPVALGGEPGGPGHRRRVALGGRRRPWHALRALARGWTPDR